MENKIVKLAIAVLDKVKARKSEEYGQNLLNNRINKIEDSLENIADNLRILLKK